MLWGCMLWDGPHYICRIDGWMGTFSFRFWMMNFKKALLIIANLLRTSYMSKTITPNTPAKKAQEWFKNHGFTLIQWPPQYPD